LLHLDLVPSPAFHQTRLSGPASISPSPPFSFFFPLIFYQSSNLHHELAQVDVRSVRPFCAVVTDRIHAGSLSAVVGTEEPIYGPEAIQSVAQQTETTPYSEVNKDLLRWRAYSYTNVETQTFYIMADNGTVVFVQVIYSNIV
jgi:hypothetical protein